MLTRPGAALITAGGKRLGAEIAKTLARASWDVAIHCRGDIEQAQALVQTLRADGVRAQAFMAELTDPQQVLALFDAVTQNMGSVDVVINNASEFSEPATDDFFEWAHFNRIMQANVSAPLLLSQKLFEHCQARASDGVVINVLDQKLWNLNPDHLAYTLSKSALHTATLMLAQRCAPILRVNAVAPGLALPAPGQASEAFERVNRNRLSRTPVDPVDIARTVLFLLENASVTGSIVLVDGGQHLVPMARDFSFL